MGERMTGVAYGARDYDRSIDDELWEDFQNAAYDRKKIDPWCDFDMGYENEEEWMGYLLVVLRGELISVKEAKALVTDKVKENYRLLREAMIQIGLPDPGKPKLFFFENNG